MAFTRLVDARENRIDDANSRAPRDAPCRSAISRAHAPIGIGGCLEGAHDARADRNDAAAAELRPRDLNRGMLRDGYGSSKGRRESSAGSPVEETPAACVSVAKPTPRRRQAWSVRQSSAKPADGASNATGPAAIFVQTSQSTNGSGTCAYWIGRPCCASPASTAARLPRKCSSNIRVWSRTRSTTALSGPSRTRSPADSAGGGGRSSVRMR